MAVKEQWVRHNCVTGATGDRELVFILAHFCCNPQIPARLLSECRKAVWDHQDGYGEPGYTPPQGWDWSGIRDSSQAAWERMAVACRTLLHNAGVRDFIYLKIVL